MIDWDGYGKKRLFNVYTLRQTTENLSQYSQSSLQDSNRAVLVYEAGMITSTTYRSDYRSLILLEYCEK
jgi:hypothetical protein